MKDTLNVALPWVLSAWTMFAMWIAGGNPRLGWKLALWGQIFWWSYTFTSSAWGFMPLNIGLTLIYWRNLTCQPISTHAES